MTAQIQAGGFSHAKCFVCGHMGRLESFEVEPVKLAESENENGKIDVSQLIVKCPICNSTNTEALFPNEVN
jgi:hypothetical protein